MLDSYEIIIFNIEKESIDYKFVSATRLCLDLTVSNSKLAIAKSSRGHIYNIGPFHTES